MLQGSAHTVIVSAVRMRMVYPDIRGLAAYRWKAAGPWRGAGPPAAPDACFPSDTPTLVHSPHKPSWASD